MSKTVNNKTISKYLKTSVLGKINDVTNISKFPNNKEKSISFLQNKPKEKLFFSKESTVLASKENYEILKKYKVSVIISKSPKYDLALISNKYFKKKYEYFIDKSVKIGKNCIINPSVKIDRGVTIGQNVDIGKNTYIGENVIINSNTKIYESVKIYPGTIIGIDAFSFGYRKDAEEKYIKLPSLGGVIIDSNVHIGHNCVIAKGIFDNTVIGKYTKINDLSHIGNTVSIGSNSFIMANADISARVKIGDNCWIAQSVCIMQGLSIGNNVQIGMGSIVTKNIKNNVVAYGQPAKFIRKRR